jgi:hypothetical protein
MTTAVYLADRKSPSFGAVCSSVDVVCAGDSITGWNNIGEVEGWPFPTYPESLQRLCEPSGLTVANCGIAGEVSPNGIGQVRDYLELFPTARYFVLGYGANDLDKWPEVERTSPRIVENLDRMVEAIGHGGGRRSCSACSMWTGRSCLGRSSNPCTACWPITTTALGGTAGSVTSRSWRSGGSCGTSTSPTRTTRTTRGLASSPGKSSGY